MTAPKEFWELSTILSKLRSDDEEKQRLAALHLKAHASREARTRTSLEFNLYMEEICKIIHDFCGSHNRNERLGGILMIRNLVEVVYAEHDLHLQKMGRYLQKIIDHQTSIKDDIPELAAKTLGHLIQANPTSADIFDHQVKQAFEWLREGSRNEYHIYMAMLVIRELAKSAPTLFNEHVPFFIKPSKKEGVWVGITDQKIEIRETSKLALRQVLVLIGKKKASNSYQQLFKQAKKKISETKNSSQIHGAILVIGELLDQEEQSYMMQVYDDICKMFFLHKDNGPAFLTEAIIKLMPRLARFDPERFSRNYLDQCIRHIIQEHKIQTVDPQVTYAALGGVAMAVRGNIMQNVPAIISILDEGLTKNRRQRSVVTHALRCIAMLAEAIGPLLTTHANDLVDKMIKNGLTADQGEDLVHALTALVEHVKDDELLRDIQKRLLAAIFQILTPSAALTTSIGGSGGSGTGDAVAAAGQYMIPTDIGIMGDVLKILRTSSSSSSSQDNKSAEPAVVRLALKTIGTFNFHNIRLLWFVCQCLIRYLDHRTVDVREAAALACSNLLLRPEDPFLKGNLSKTHYRAMVYRVLEQLLTVGIADPIPKIRETVIKSLKPRFDAFLAQAENLHALFVALNDENFDIRAAAISVIGRLALRNPAYVMPSLRKTLVHLLTQVQYGADTRSQEQSCKLLGHLVESSDLLTKPYLPAILKVLLPSLRNNDPRLVACVIETIGKLEKIGGKELEPHLPELLQFLLSQLKNRAQDIDREVLLSALGRLIRTTGHVIRPYLQHPSLLPTLLHVLSTEVKWNARLEVVKVLGILGALDPYQHKINQTKLRDRMEAEKRKGQTITKGSRARLNAGGGGRGAQGRGAEKKQDRAGRVSVNPTRVTDDRYLLPSMVGSLDEYYSTVAMNALMRILAEPTMAGQHIPVMQSATYVFRSLGPKCAVFLPRIVPTLLNVIRTAPDDQNTALQKEVLMRLQELVSIVGKDMRPYLEDIFKVIYGRWTRARSYGGVLAVEVLALIEKISLALRDEFKFYLPELIPHFLRALHGTAPPLGPGSSPLTDEKLSIQQKQSSFKPMTPVNSKIRSGLGQRILTTIQTFGSNLEDYLHLLIPTLMRLAESMATDSSNSLGESAVETIAKLSTKLDFRDYVSCVVHPTARILASVRDPNRRDKVMAMLLAVIRQMGVDFLLFVPLINNALELQNRGAVKEKWDQKDRSRLTNCVDGYNWMVDIIMRGETPSVGNLDKALQTFKGKQYLSWDRERKIVREMAAREKPAIFEQKLTIDTETLKKAWSCKNKVTKEDWLQWMGNFQIKLLEFSPSTSLRPCVTLAKRYPVLARDLFNAAFLSVWTELDDHAKDNLVLSLETALRFSTPPEVLQILLNLAEFMEREGRALPILQDERKNQPTLGQLAEHCHAFAKALHYKEIEFKSAPQDTIESLISINNDLQQPDAAVGILKCAQDMSGMELQPSWYEKLQRWEDALEEYEVLQLHHQDDLAYTRGRMRCLDALGLWSRMSAMCDDIWTARVVPAAARNTSLNFGVNASLFNRGTSSLFLHEDEKGLLLSEPQILDIARFGASAAWELRDWGGMVKYVARMPEGTLDTSIFRTVLAIQEEHYADALRHIASARRSVFPELRSLVAESYNRAYGHMVKVQVLAELEEVVAYKRSQRPAERAHIRAMWRERLRGTQRDITVWRHIMAARKLVLRPREQIDTIVDFSALARKSQRLALSLQALAPFLRPTATAIGGEEGLAAAGEDEKGLPGGGLAVLRANPGKVKLPLAYPRVCLAYLVHLWDAGYREEALRRLERLLEDLNPRFTSPRPMSPTSPGSPFGGSYEELQGLAATAPASSGWQPVVGGGGGGGGGNDDYTRMECHLTLGQWQRKLGGDSPENLAKVLQAYRRATRICKDSYHAWHAYASVHFRMVSLLDSEAKGLESSGKGDKKDGARQRRAAIETHVVPAIDGFFRAIALAGLHRSTLQDVLRLLTLWFNHGGSEHPLVNASLSKGFNTTSIQTWLKVIPQIIARIYTVDPGVRKLVEHLLRKIGKEHPQALIYSLTVASKSQVPARQKAAEGIMNYMRKHSEKLVDQAQLISTELIRVAILWHEMWHDALEEASKFWFGKRNASGMLQVVEPLHQMMAKGPQTMREVAFQQRYGRDLTEAKEWCERYKQSGNESDLNQAWDAYCNVWRRINKNRETLVTVELQHASPKLRAVRHLELAVPGTYEEVVLHQPYVSPTASSLLGLNSPQVDEKNGNGFSGLNGSLSQRNGAIGRGGHFDHSSSMNGLDSPDDDEGIIRIAWFQPRLKVIESKQRPRRLTIIGSDGMEYSFLLKGREDLRQDERVMQLFGLVNTLLATDDQTTQKNLSIHRYSVIPLAPNSGLIQWLENCDTLHSLIKEYRDARSILIQVETLLIKAFSNKVYEHMTVIQKIEVFEYALSKTSGLDLYHVLWLKSQDSETWLDRRTNYTRSLAVMCMVGYILGLGDRHPCNLMLDQFSGKIIHIDFGDCFEVAMHREKFPEKIPFRLTRMLINAMEVSGIEGNFRATCEAVMRVLRTHKESVMAVLEAFVYDPLINWRLLQTKVSRLHENPDQKDDIDEEKVLSEESTALLGDEAEDTTQKEAGAEVLNQKALTVIGRIASKLDGQDFGDGEPLNVPQQVEKLIRQATSHANLCQCYIGWCPFW